MGRITNFSKLSSLARRNVQKRLAARGASVDKSGNISSTTRSSSKSRNILAVTRPRVGGGTVTATAKGNIVERDRFGRLISRLSPRSSAVKRFTRKEGKMVLSERQRIPTRNAPALKIDVVRTPGQARQFAFLRKSSFGDFQKIGQFSVKPTDVVRAKTKITGASARRIVSKAGIVPGSKASEAFIKQVEKGIKPKDVKLPISVWLKQPVLPLERSLLRRTIPGPDVLTEVERKKLIKETQGKKLSVSNVINRIRKLRFKGELEKLKIKKLPITKLRKPRKKIPITKLRKLKQPKPIFVG